MSLVRKVWGSSHPVHRACHVGEGHGRQRERGTAGSEALLGTWVDYKAKLRAFQGSETEPDGGGSAVSLGYERGPGQREDTKQGGRDHFGAGLFVSLGSVPKDRWQHTEATASGSGRSCHPETAFRFMSQQEEPPERFVSQEGSSLRPRAWASQSGPVGRGKGCVRLPTWTKLDTRSCL